VSLGWGPNGERERIEASKGELRRANREKKGEQREREREVVARK